MTKAFLFDYDGVYTPGANNDWVFARLAENLNIPFETAAAWSEQIWIPFIKGSMHEDEVWAFFESEYGKPIPRDKRDIWFRWEELTPHPDMVRLVRLLKNKGYVVGVLSNIFPNNMATIVAHGGYDEFEVIIASCDVGYKKPDKEIFEYALQQLADISASEVVFLDDRERNAKASEAVGMKGIHVTSQAQAIADITALIEQ